MKQLWLKPAPTSPRPLHWKKVACPLQSRGELLSQMEEYLICWRKEGAEPKGTAFCNFCRLQFINLHFSSHLWSWTLGHHHRSWEEGARGRPRIGGRVPGGTYLLKLYTKIGLIIINWHLLWSLSHKNVWFITCVNNDVLFKLEVKVICFPAFHK